MRAARRVQTVLGWMVFSGCGSPAVAPEPLTPPGSEAVPTDTGAPGGPAVMPPGCPDPLDWSQVGHPMMLTYCTACHSSTATPSSGLELPGAIHLDTVAGVRTHLERVRARISEGTMPPGGGLGAMEAACLLAWLDHGAPGADSALPVLDVPSSARNLAWEVWETVEAGDSTPGSILLVTELTGIGHTTQIGLWSIEEWDVDGDAAWLVSRTRFDAVGEVLYEDVWDPPLPMFAGETSMETTRTRWLPSGLESATEIWDLSTGVPASVFPRSSDPAPLRSHAVERASGWEVGVDLSEDHAFTARWFEGFEPDGGLMEIRQVSPLRPEAVEGFPVRVGQEWSSRSLGAIP